MPRGPSRPYPSVSILEAAGIAQGIRDHNAGKPMNRILLAEALRTGPASSDFREMLSASVKYGFTKGNYQSEAIELTELGEQLTKPRSESEKLDAQRQGFRRIRLFDQLLAHFNNNKLPATGFLKNTLEREPFNVATEWSAEAAEVFVTSGRVIGFIRDIGESPWVVTEAGHPTVNISEEPEAAELKDESSPPEVQPAPPFELDENKETASVTLPGAQQPSATLQFFIAHGHDKQALQQVQKILDELGIPYMVAVEEANAGRPISQKVKDLMDACSGGIFIFSADEEFNDKEGNTIFRPRENVIYELGAASYKYDRRIVIFKEKSVTFPTDFRDLGFIEYEKGQLAGKSMDLLRELIALKAVKLLPGS